MSNKLVVQCHWTQDNPNPIASYINMMGRSGKVLTPLAVSIRPKRTVVTCCLFSLSTSCICSKRMMHATFKVCLASVNKVQTCMFTAVWDDCLWEMKSPLVAALNNLHILMSSLNYLLNIFFVNYKQVWQSWTQIVIIVEITELPSVIFWSL